MKRRFAHRPKETLRSGTRFRPWRAAAWSGSLAILCGIMVYLLQPRFIRLLDLQAYDLLLPAYERSMRLPPPVIIDIDEASLESHGPWPWPRFLVAKLIGALTDIGVTAVGLDMVLSGQEHASPKRIQGVSPQEQPADGSRIGLPEEGPDVDAVMAAALRKAPVVLGAFARTGDGTGGQAALPAGYVAEKTGLRRTEKFPGKLLPRVRSIVAPLPLLRAAAPIGLVNLERDQDGVVRRLHLLRQAGDEIYPALPLRLFMRALDIEIIEMQLRPDAGGLRALRAGELALPVGRDGSMLIPFHADGRACLQVSAGAVLRGEVFPELLRGRIALVGSSASGIALPYSIPRLKSVPGVAVHAAALDALANGAAVAIPDWAGAAQTAGIVLFGSVAALAFSFGNTPACLATAGFQAAAGIVAARLLFMQGLFLSPVCMLLTGAAAGLIILPLRFMRRQRQARRLRIALSRYMPSEIIQRIADGQDDSLSGEERELSILFTDIRGFSAISEKLAPPLAASLLNRCFAPMTAIVREYGGTPDKFIGDALMAFWNAPLNIERHPVRAVEAALAMHERLGLINTACIAEFGFSVAMGTGINTGNVYVGNMGSTEFASYTLIGDNVNLAARIEKLCVVYGVPIVASEETMLRCAGAFGVQYLDTLRVRGRENPVSIFMPLRRNDYAGRREEIADWGAARALYAKGKFKEAANAFAKLHSAFPGVRLYALYLERARRLYAHPPCFWDGIWNMG